MEFKGTTQKWELTHVEVSEEVFSPYYYIQGEYDCESVCILPKNGSITTEKLKANAKLIACAPEMLEELIHLEDYITRSLVLSGCDQKSIDYILRNTRPLIKKATE